MRRACARARQPSRGACARTRGLSGVRRDQSRFRGADSLRLLGLIETERSAREATLATGEALLDKGAVGHNHFWFRRYAIEAALQGEPWDEADAHADALTERTAAEPLPYSDLIAERGHILARMGRGTAGDEDFRELGAVRAKAAAAGYRIDALGDALRAG